MDLPKINGSAKSGPAVIMPHAQLGQQSKDRPAVKEPSRSKPSFEGPPEVLVRAQREAQERAWEAVAAKYPSAKQQSGSLPPLERAPSVRPQNPHPVTQHDSSFGLGTARTEHFTVHSDGSDSPPPNQSEEQSIPSGTLRKPGSQAQTQLM
eukprot:11718966-Karenia_brevis.AAC.1